MRRLFMLLGLIGLAVAVDAEVRFSRVAVTATSQTVTLNSGEVLIINDDTTNEIYVRIFTEGEDAADATTSSTEIKAGEGFDFPRSLSIKAVSLICASGETASVRLIYW